MSIPKLIEDFYGRIWNSGDVDAVSEILAENVQFRGSLGVDLQGREAFLEYVRYVRGSLADYRCEVLECVSEGRQAFAKMRFSGVHVAPFRGYSTTNMPVHWLGAALFRFEADQIVEIWVLGDIAGLEAVLKSNEGSAVATGSSDKL